MRQFNVSVLVSLQNRAARGLTALSRDFSSTERRARELQMRLRMLEMSQSVMAKRATLAAQADKDAISLLGQRHAKLLALGDLESTLAQRRQLNAAIRQREERAALRRASEQLAMTRQLNREAQVRGQIASEEAAGAARAGMIRGGIALGAGLLGIGFGVHAAKQAGQLQMNETLLRALFGYSPQQTAGIRSQAFALQQRLGNLTASQVEQTLLELQQAGLSRRTAGAILPEVASAADVLLRARGTPIDQTATTLAQLSNLFNARTAGQFRPIGEAAFKASLLAPGSLGMLQTQAGYLSPLLRRGFSPIDLIKLAVVAQRLGGEGAVSPENLSSLLIRAQVAGGPLAPMALGGRGYYGAMRLGLPQFLHAHPHFGIGQFLGLLQSDRQRLGSQQFLTLSKLAFGTEGLRTIEQLSKPQTLVMLRQLTQQMDRMQSSARVNAASLNTLYGQMGLLRSNVGSLIQVLGQPLVGPLQTFNHLLAQTAGSLTTIMNRHPKTTAALGQVGFTASLFAAARGGLSSVSWVLKKAAASGWLTNSARFAGGLDLISAALGRLFPLVMAAQVGMKAGSVVGPATMRTQMRYGRPLTYPTMGGGIPVMDLSSLFGKHSEGHPLAHGVIVRGDIHLHGVQNPRQLAEKLKGHLAKEHIRAMKSGVANHGSANPVSVSPHIYGGYAGGPE